MKSDKTLSELRIARAYIMLLCIPEPGSGMSISVARIGNCEIRIFEGPRANPDGLPLFWMELFDHGARRSVDTFGCYELEEAVVVFEEFISQAVRLNEPSGPDGSGMQG